MGRVESRVESSPLVASQSPPPTTAATRTAEPTAAPLRPSPCPGGGGYRGSGGQPIANRGPPPGDPRGVGRGGGAPGRPLLPPRNPADSRRGAQRGEEPLLGNLPSEAERPADVLVVDDVVDQALLRLDEMDDALADMVGMD